MNIDFLRFRKLSIIVSLWLETIRIKVYLLRPTAATHIGSSFKAAHNLLRSRLLENLVYFFASVANRSVIWLQKHLNLLIKNDFPILLEFDLVLRLNKCPVNALEDTLLDQLLVGLQCVDQEIHVVFDKIDFSLLLLAQGIKLKHENKTLRCFLNYWNFIGERQKLDTDIKVVKDLINQLRNFDFSSSNNFIKLTQDQLNNVKQYFSAPVLFISEHVLDNGVTLLNDLELVHLLEW